mmetsp:Transcript_15832/g.37319  ORF Transcript_15832/g.37319 Transcript_15832/m.37319 type:complete len:590 (-) Transcript_15832:7-1776(-)
MDGMEEPFDRAVRLACEGARLEQEAMELDTVGDGTGAVEYYRRAAVKLSQAVAAAGDHHRDWATIRAHIMQVDARISYLDSLRGSPPLIPLEDHIKRVELCMGASNPDDGPGIADEWEVLEGGSAMLFDPSWEETAAARSLAKAAWIPRRMAELGSNAADKVAALDHKFNLSGKARLASVQTQQALEHFCERHKVAETLDQGLSQASAIVANLLGDAQDGDLERRQRMVHTDLVVKAEEDAQGGNTGWFLIEENGENPRSLQAADSQTPPEECSSSTSHRKNLLSPLLGSGICFEGSPLGQQGIASPLQEQRIDAFGAEANIDEAFLFSELQVAPRGTSESPGAAGHEREVDERSHQEGHRDNSSSAFALDLGLAFQLPSPQRSPQASIHAAASSCFPDFDKPQGGESEEAVVEESTEEEFQHQQTSPTEFSEEPLAQQLEADIDSRERSEPQVVTEKGTALLEAHSSTGQPEDDLDSCPSLGGEGEGLAAGSTAGEASPSSLDPSQDVSHCCSSGLQEDGGCFEVRHVDVDAVLDAEALMPEDLLCNALQEQCNAASTDARVQISRLVDFQSDSPAPELPELSVPEGQ